MSRFPAFSRVTFLLCLPVAFADGPKDDVKVPKGLLPILWPNDNPYAREKWELGRYLFFDQRLSYDYSISCAYCHDPKNAFADSSPNSRGVRGHRGNRSAPTILNRAYSLAQFWDGRAATLEEQAKGPIANPGEMATPHEEVERRLKGIRGYVDLFDKVFGPDSITIDNVAKAIATFERTVLSGNSAYDKYKAGNKKAMSPAQVRGMDVFFNKAKCDQCHEGINFTSNSYHNLGVGTDKPEPDEGRQALSKDPKDWAAFKTPTLREIAKTAPYMHDGSLKTLEEVVDYYDKGGKPNKNLDEKIQPLKLSARDKADLVQFLHALSGEGWQGMTCPTTLPE